MPQTKQTLSVPFLYRTCHSSIWALTVLLFCYICSSPSLTPALPRNLCFLFLLLSFVALVRIGKKFQQKKNNILFCGNCTKPKTILIKITLEFQGVICRSLFAGEEMGYCTSDHEQLYRCLQSVIQINCCRDHDLGVDATLF